MKKKTMIIYYSLSGVSKRIANILQDKTGGDIYEIRTARTYDSDMWKAWEEAKDELKSGKLPELTGQLPDLTSYDTILVGGGVWGYTLSNPLLAYLRKNDFKGKTVSAYWTFYDHDEKYADAIKKECKNAVVKNGLPLPMSIIRNKSALDKKLEEWIKSIDTI